MGVMRFCFAFALGAACGVYVTQSYSVPNLRRHCNRAMVMAKHYEETYRKPGAGTDAADEKAT